MISPLIYSHADYVKQNDKNQETITSRFFPEQKTKESSVNVICLQYTKFWPEFGSHYLDKLSVHQFTWSGKVYINVHLTVSLGISKTMPLATMSQQAHACWKLRNWSPSTWLVYGHFIQIHSCMGICFSCMYTRNHEHFHKWFHMFTGIQG